MKDRIAFAARVGIGVLFVWSGLMKLVEPYQNFLAVVYTYKIVSGVPAQAVAIGLPWLEVLAGAFFAAGLWTRASCAALWAMNVSFLVGLGSAFARGIPLKDCGCFGEAARGMSPWVTFALDLVLFGAFAWFWFFDARPPKRSFDRLLDD